MNIGFSLFRKTIGIIAVAIIPSISAATALAGPNQLDILGLILGKSDLHQAKQLSEDQENQEYLHDDNDTIVKLKIGGHIIPCSVSLRDGKLDALLCPTGSGEGKIRLTEASNTDVHSTLMSGFTRKFGKPDSVIEDSVSTRLGAKYKQQFVTWKDKRGNKLKLILIYNSVDMGLITFQSSAYLKEMAEREAAEEAQKKF